VNEAVRRVLPLLQESDSIFLSKTSCVSCHNNALTEITIAEARKNRFTINDSMTRKNTQFIDTYLSGWRERVLQGVGIPGDADTVGYILLALAALNHHADTSTDAMAIFLKNRQLPNGQWTVVAHRPPLESSDIEVTAISMHALRVFAPPALQADFKRAVRLASTWLQKAEPRNNEDQVFQILGLHWGGADRAMVRRLGRKLTATQQPDGGWAQLATLRADAYATGQALTALHESGVVEPNSKAYRRGIRFLLDTQLADGTWHVKTRAVPIQPDFESGFPHGRDQWISVAATNWATQALLFLAAQ
jgi:squalene cyclase